MDNNRIKTKTYLITQDTRASVWVDVYVDNVLASKNQVVSGPKNDVEEFYKGVITLKELEMRWEKKLVK